MKIKYLKEYDKQRIGIRTKSKRRIEYGILNVDLKRNLVTFKTDGEEIILLPSEIMEIKINEKQEEEEKWDHFPPPTGQPQHKLQYIVIYNHILMFSLKYHLVQNLLIKTYRFILINTINHTLYTPWYTDWYTKYYTKH